MVIEGLASQDNCIPTLIANAPAPSEVVIGDALTEVICKYLMAGQVLKMFGGYIVRGGRLGCDRRARAIRNHFGAFDVVQFIAFDMARLTPLQPTPPQAPRIAEAMPTVGTPSPVAAILPMLEAQVVEQGLSQTSGSALPQVSARVQHCVQLQQQLQLPQQRQQQAEQQRQQVEQQQHQQQQEVDRVVIERLTQLAVGKGKVKQEQTPPNHEQTSESQKLINILLDK